LNAVRIGGWADAVRQGYPPSHGFSQRLSEQRVGRGQRRAEPFAAFEGKIEVCYRRGVFKQAGRVPR